MVNGTRQLVNVEFMCNRQLDDVQPFLVLFSHTLARFVNKITEEWLTSGS